MSVETWKQGVLPRMDINAQGVVTTTWTLQPASDGVRIMSDTQKRPLPTDLLLSMTGRSQSEYQSSYKPINLSPPSTGGALLRPPQEFGCNATGPFLITSSEKSDMVAKIDNKILGKLRGVKWDAATSLVEFGQTLRFVDSVMRELIQYYKLARKGDLLGLANLYHKRDWRGRRRPPLPDRLRDRYLAYRYAVRPLAADLDSALAEYARSGVYPVVRRIAAKDQTHKSGATSDFYQGNPSYKRTITSAESHEVVRVVYFTINPSVEDIKRLGFTNLASVLWNVSPFSFMFDWVLPIGEFVASLDAKVGVGLKADYRSTKTKWDTGVFIRNGGATQQGRSASRVVHLGLPSFSFRLSPSVDALKLLDTAAIFDQLRNQPGPHGFRRA